MTGMHVREPRPCTSPLRGEHSGYKGPTHSPSNNIFSVAFYRSTMAGLFTFSGHVTSRLGALIRLQ